MYQRDSSGMDSVSQRLDKLMNLKLLTESFLDIILVVDINGRIQYLNPAYQHITGIDAVGKTGNTVRSSVNFHPDDYDMVMSLVQQGLAQAKPDIIEFRYRRADGNYIWMETSTNPIFDEMGNFMGLVCISRNVSARKGMESALLESEVKFKNQAGYLNTLIENMNEILYTYDREGRLTFANRKCVELFDYPLEDVLGQKVVNFVSEPSKLLVHENIKMRLDTGGNDNYEASVITRSGTECLLNLNVAPIIEDGTISGGIVVAEDITERRRMENEQNNQLNFLQKLIDSLPSPIFYKDTQALYQGCNKAFEAACGLAMDKIIGRSACDVFPLDMNEYHHQTDMYLLRTGGAQEHELALHYADGLSHDVLINRAAYTNMDGSIGGLVGIIMDITERKQLQKKVLVLERLNIMGQMAAGIAHEIRNPMTTARGFLQMLGDREDLRNYREYFELIIEELDRANGIITEFLSLGKAKAVNLKMQNLNDVVKTLYPLILADALNADKNLLIKLSDIPDLYIDDLDIRQLILNLVRNGLEAMAPGEVMHIVTYIDNHDVILSVQDQGQGINPDVLEKLGTPFLTTKEQGTGLGLAICYSIAARHNAFIEVETGITGTNFKVRFKPPSCLTGDGENI